MLPLKSNMERAWKTLHMMDRPPQTLPRLSTVYSLQNSLRGSLTSGNESDNFRDELIRKETDIGTLDRCAQDMSCSRTHDNIPLAGLPSSKTFHLRHSSSIQTSGLVQSEHRSWRSSHNIPLSTGLPSSSEESRELLAQRT